jgi:hypothetical protein
MKLTAVVNSREGNIPINSVGSEAIPSRLQKEFGNCPLIPRATFQFVLAQCLVYGMLWRLSVLALSINMLFVL